MSVRIVNDTKGAGLAALARRLRNGSDQVKVGVPAGPQENDGMSIAKLAAIMEYGGHVKPHTRAKGQTIWFNPRTGRFVSRMVTRTRLKLVYEVKAKAATFENGITIPARPFLRPGIRKNLMAFTMMNVNSLRDIANGKTTIPAALGRLGAVAAGKVKQEIRDGAHQANAPSTIKKKGSNKPLIDSGMLRQAVTWVLGGGSWST